ncbi:MAG: tetrahydrofolate dehydrogenase/cyclohydrolase catalytic domain-containing protein [Candidatus Moraniibacteriota bacterium]|jgi:methylenetetrahydrofolate dehydrogenase (NADP+) / methenyltetrahydrofolate cyclohydrolase
MKFIDGKKIAAKKLVGVKDIASQLDAEPALAVVLIGDDPASHLYVKLKERAAKKIGVELRKYTFNTDISMDEVKSAIEFLNKDVDTNGIIVQLPLPEQLDVDEVIGFIDPEKDVDGFHKVNQERFLNNKECIYPVFPNAIMSLVDSELESLENKKVTIIGKSDVFDNVMTHAFKVEGANVKFISCINKDEFSTSEQLSINESDVVVTACGKKNLLSCDLISDNTIIIDGGISKDGDKTVGDVDIIDCEDREIIISPVPGGVGPVTIACLLENIVELTKRQSS